MLSKAKVNEPTEQHLDPIGDGVTLVEISKDGQVEGRFDEAEPGTIGSKRKLRVGGRSCLKTLLPGDGGCLDGNGGLGEVGGHRIPDGLVETVVIAKEDVISAQAAIVFNDWDY